MNVEDLELPGVKLVKARKFADARGFFSETYAQEKLAAAGIGETFVQDNQSLSHVAGTVRGLHFQTPPFAQAKLVRVLRGSIFDVAVDIRHGSPDFGRHVGVILSVEAWNQLYIPIGFAHGFCTLEPDTEVAYKVTAPYSAPHDGGISWKDPALAIGWPIEPEAAQLSDKDRDLPLLRDLPELFTFER